MSTPVSRPPSTTGTAPPPGRSPSLVPSVPSFVLLHVRSPAVSAEFWSARLGRAPIDASPTFVLFALDGGWKLGLWRADGVVPPAAAPGGCELGFPVADDATLDHLHDAWVADGVDVLQPPTAMDFGRTFTVADPDGHRLRVWRLAA